MLPTFIGIGAPKAGTTWLSNALYDHPNICMPVRKETDFFSYRYRDHSIEYYESLFECGEAPQAVGEFSTGYLSHPQVPARIASDLPGVRLLAVLRNPVEQVYSHYWHLQRQNFHTEDPRAAHLSFEEALVQFEGRLVRPAQYAAHLDRWFEHFGRDRFLIHLFDDVQSDPDGVVSSVYGFVGADPAWRPSTVQEKGRQARAGTAPRSARAARWGSAAYHALNRYAYVPLKRLLGENRAEALKNRLGVREALEVAFRTKGYPKMSDATRKQLTERFAEPNRRLGEMLDRDLSHWNA